jgi:Fe-Mn family superoxide dismutase
MPYELPPLRFAYHELEPHIPADTLRRHHAVIHRGYVDGINAVLRDHPELDGQTIEDLLRSLPRLPDGVRDKVRNVGGGHANHQFLWKVIGPGRGGAATGELAVAIERRFGSFAAFRQRFIETALALVGSGWTFLSLDRSPNGSGELEVFALPNNDSVLPLAKPGILICDLWEHGYCARHDDRRADYLEAYFNVIDWDVCDARLRGIRAGVRQL